MRRRRLTVLILLFLALALSGGAIFIANELANQSTAPDDAAAGSKICCDGGGCSDGRTFGPDTNGIPHSSCSVRAKEFCGNASVNGGAEITCPGGGDSGGGNQPPAESGICRTGNRNCVNQPYGYQVPGTCACTRDGAEGNCICIANVCNSSSEAACVGKTVGQDSCVNVTPTAGSARCVKSTQVIQKCREDLGSISCRGKDYNAEVSLSDGSKCICTPTNNGCSCVTSSPPNTGGNTGGGGTDAQGSGTGTTPDGAECSTTAQCLPGAYCQGRENARRCQRPTPNQCPSGSCTGYLAFKCTELTATGECLSNPLTVSSLSAGLAHSAGCGQVDQVCVGGDRDRNLCGEFIIQDNSCTTTPPIVVTPPPVVIQQPICGDSCSSSAQCPTGMVCNASKCTKTECVDNVCGPDASCGAPIICGQGCNTNGQCPTGQTCSAGTCVLNTCLTPGNCSGNCQAAACGDGTVNPGEQCNEPGLTCSASSTCNTSTCLCEPGRCGGTCASDSECPSGNTCNAGTCKLDFCLEGSGNCAADNCTVIGCGDQCAPGNLCPNGHTCQNGRCANNACLNGGCDADGCIALPRTNLFAPENRILLSMILISMGILIYKTGVSARVVNYLSTNLVNRRDTKKKKFEEELS